MQHYACTCMSTQSKSSGQNRNYFKYWAQLFKTKNVVSSRIVKTSIIKNGIYDNIFAEKNVRSFCICNSCSHFSANIHVNYILYFPSEKESTLKGKKFFPFRVGPFSGGILVENRAKSEKLSLFVKMAEIY